MPYSTESSRWNAFQFIDPLAAGCFVVCRKQVSQYCRPDCEARPPTPRRASVIFMNTPELAERAGYTPCVYCYPQLTPTVDIHIIAKTITQVNKEIGFVPSSVEPSSSDFEFVSAEQPHEMANIPKLSAAGSRKLLRNEPDHSQLVDFACRHIAAAAVNALLASLELDSSSNEKDKNLKQETDRKTKKRKIKTETEIEETAQTKKDRKGNIFVMESGISEIKKKKRRGGVLGFKELASKAKLSPWHFHRVFKSITKMTPKAYGDLCWDIVSKRKDFVDALKTGAASSAYSRRLSAQEAALKQQNEKKKKAKVYYYGEFTSRPSVYNLTDSTDGMVYLPSFSDGIQNYDSCVDVRNQPINNINIDSISYKPSSLSGFPISSDYASQPVSSNVPVPILMSLMPSSLTLPNASFMNATDTTISPLSNTDPVLNMTSDDDIVTHGNVPGVANIEITQNDSSSIYYTPQLQATSPHSNPSLNYSPSSSNGSSPSDLASTLFNSGPDYSIISTPDMNLIHMEDIITPVYNANRNCKFFELKIRESDLFNERIYGLPRKSKMSINPAASKVNEFVRIIDNPFDGTYRDDFGRNFNTYI